MKDETIIKWDFEQLFGVPCVSAKVRAPKSNPDLKWDYLRRIEMVEVQQSKFAPPGRNIAMDVYWHSRKDGKRGGLWGDSLFETLANSGAEKEGCSRKDSFTVYWLLKPRERFTDGAMRVAKLIFRMLEIKMEGTAHVKDEMLISLFVVYKLTWIPKGSFQRIRFDDYLRKRHKLPPSPVGLRIHVL